MDGIHIYFQMGIFHIDSMPPSSINA